MALNDNSTVSIVINVVDSTSAQVLSSTQARLQGVGTSAQQAGVLVDQFGRAFEQAGMSAAAFQAQVAGVGSAAAAAGAEGAAGMDRLANSIQGVRLAGQDMGIHVPRAMYSIIAANQTLMAGVSALFGVFVAIGAISIFEQMIAGAVNLYKEWFDVTKAVEDYQQKAGEAAQQKLFDTSSIETANSLLAQTNKEIDDLEAKKRASGADQPGGGFLQYFAGPMHEPGTRSNGTGVTPPPYTSGDDARAAQAMKDRQAAQDRVTEQQEQFDKERTESQAAYDSATTKGYDQIAAKLRDNIALAVQEYQIQQQHEKTLHDTTVAANAAETAKGVDPSKRTPIYQVDPTAGTEAYAVAWDKAHQEAAAAGIALSRKENDEVIQMQDQALDAGLKGEALLQAQKEQAIAAVVRKFNEGEISKQAKMAETAAINLKYDNEKMERLAQQERETEKLEREVQQAGLTGIAKLQADGANKAADIGDDPTLAPAQKARRQAAAQQTTNAEIEQAQREFYQQMSEMEQHSDSSMLEGYARMDAATQEHLGRIYDEYQKTFGQLDPLVLDDLAKIVAGTAAMETAITNITTQADRERIQEHQKTMEQIAQTEQQAARLTLPPWQAAQQDILDQFNQRVQKQTDLINQNAISWEEYCVAIQADYKLAMAQMEKAAEQTRDQLASQLSSFFNDPAGYLKKRAEDMMFQILANWMMQLMQFNSTAGGLLGGLFGMNGQMSTSTNPATALGSIFGIHRSTHGAMNESLGIPGGLGTAGTTLTSAGTTLSSAGTTLSSSGTMLTSSATALNSAATALSTAASQMSTSGGGGGSILGGLSGGAGGGGDAAAGGDWGLGSGDTSAPSFTQSPNASFGDLGMSDSNDAAWGDLNVGSGASPLDPLGPLGHGDVTSGTGIYGTVGGDVGSDPNDPAPGPGTPVFPGDDLGSGLSIAGGMAAIGGTLAMVNAWKTNNTGAAILSGAATGAGIGTMILPGIGTAIGAVGGALVGFIGSLFGDHGTSKAKQYDQQTVQPALAKELHEFDAGQLGYTQATADLTNLQTQTYNELWGLGSGARHYYTNNILPEFTTAQQQLMQQMQGGRDQVTFSAAQYHDGGTISHFGSLWTSPGTGFIHAKLGETVMNPAASSSFAPVLAMMNSGMLSRGSRMPASSGGSGDVHFHIDALDAQSFTDFLRRGGAMKIRSAINQSSSRYGGFSDN